MQALLSDAVIDTPTTFRQSSTDADNQLKTNIGATYVQDQIELSRKLQLVTGIRFDHFDLQYLNNRTGDNLRRIDNLVSPRAGLVRWSKLMTCALRPANKYVPWARSFWKLIWADSKLKTKAATRSS